jgi:hypothetical protein
MRSALMALLLWGLPSPAVPASSRGVLVQCQRTRSADEPAARLLSAAVERSPTVARLLDDIEQSDVIVYVRLSIVAPTARLALSGSTSTTRYLQLSVDSRDNAFARIEWLAHELQHALEISRAPEVRDDASFQEFYARAGWPARTGERAFETQAAQDVQRRVRNELIASTQGGAALTRPWSTWAPCRGSTRRALVRR